VKEFAAFYATGFALSASCDSWSEANSSVEPVGAAGIPLDCWIADRNVQNPYVKARCPDLIPGSSASNDNVGESTSKRAVAATCPSAKTLLKFARYGVFCLRRQYIHATILFFFAYLRQNSSNGRDQSERGGVVI
jgi:hypothetical protein